MKKKTEEEEKEKSIWPLYLSSLQKDDHIPGHCWPERSMTQMDPFPGHTDLGVFRVASLKMVKDWIEYKKRFLKSYPVNRSTSGTP